MLVIFNKLIKLTFFLTLTDLPTCSVNSPNLLRNVKSDIPSSYDSGGGGGWVLTSPLCMYMAVGGYSLQIPPSRKMVDCPKLPSIKEKGRKAYEDDSKDKIQKAMVNSCFHMQTNTFREVTEKPKSVRL